MLIFTCIHRPFPLRLHAGRARLKIGFAFTVDAGIRFTWRPVQAYIDTGDEAATD